jgi:hypothetical protein
MEEIRMKRIALTLAVLAATALAGCTSPTAKTPASPNPGTAAPAKTEVCVTPESDSPLYANVIFGEGGPKPFAVKPGWTVPVPARPFTIELTFPKAIDRRFIKTSVESADWQLEPYKGDSFLNAYTVVAVPKGEPKAGSIALKVESVKAQDGTEMVAAPFTMSFAVVAPGSALPACTTLEAKLQK